MAFPVPSTRVITETKIQQYSELQSIFCCFQNKLNLRYLSNLTSLYSKDMSLAWFSAGVSSDPMYCPFSRLNVSLYFSYKRKKYYVNSTVEINYPNRSIYQKQTFIFFYFIISSVMLYSIFQPLWHTGKCHQYGTSQNMYGILVKLSILISNYRLVATP